MSLFLDSSVLVEACLAQSSKFSATDDLLGRGAAVTSAHALAEAYATLSGDARLKISARDAARMVVEAAVGLRVYSLSAKSYLKLLKARRPRGYAAAPSLTPFMLRPRAKQNVVRSTL